MATAPFDIEYPAWLGSETRPACDEISTIEPCPAGIIEREAATAQLKEPLTLTDQSVSRSSSLTSSAVTFSVSTPAQVAR